MVRHSVHYDGGMAFIGQGNSGQPLVMDATPESGGQGRGPTPVEALLSAIGGCTGMDIVSILGKMHTPPTAMRITLEVERATEHPRALRRVRLLFAIEGPVPEPNARRAIELSLTRYCSVLHSLSHDVDIDWEVELAAS